MQVGRSYTYPYNNRKRSVQTTICLLFSFSQRAFDSCNAGLWKISRMPVIPLKRSRPIWPAGQSHTDIYTLLHTYLSSTLCFFCHQTLNSFVSHSNPHRSHIAPGSTPSYRQPITSPPLESFVSFALVQTTTPFCPSGYAHISVKKIL